MKYSTAVPFAALALAALIAGCSNNNLATPAATPTPVPTPTVACTTPPGQQIALVFPQTTVSPVPNNQGVVIATAPNPLPTSWYVYVSSTYGNAAGGFLQPIAPNALPTPNTPPAFANPTYQISMNGIFAPATAFTAYLASATCYPGLKLGTFTT